MKWSSFTLQQIVLGTDVIQTTEVIKIYISFKKTLNRKNKCNKRWQWLKNIKLSNITAYTTFPDTISLKIIQNTNNDLKIS